MSGHFVDSLPAGFSLIVFFVALFLIEIIAFRIGRRLGPPREGAATSALNTALAAIFGIVALVLSFSFSFSLARYEQRWGLVVQETNDIGTAYLRTSTLDKQVADELRGLLRVYTQDRINYYQHDADPTAQRRDQAAIEALQGRIWTLVSGTERAHPRDLGPSLVMQATNNAIDDSAAQRAALSFRLQGSARFLVFFVAGVGALAIGLGFGCTGFPNWFVAIVFSLLLSLLLYTIIDLDSPQSGFVRLNLAPLYELQHSMAAP